MIGVFCQESLIKSFGSILFIHSNISVIVVFLSVASFTHLLTRILCPAFQKANQIRPVSTTESATVPTVRPVSSTVPTVEDIEIMTAAEKDDDGDVNAIRKVSSVVVVVRPKTTYSLAEDDGIGANVADGRTLKNVAAAVGAESPVNIPDNGDDVAESPENGDDIVAANSDDAIPPCRRGELFDVYPEVAACRERFDKFRQLIEADLEAKLGRLQDYRRHGSAAGGHSLRDRNYANIQIFMLNKYAWRLRRFRVICDGELTHLEATFRAGVNEEDVRREADHYTRLGTVCFKRCLLLPVKDSKVYENLLPMYVQPPVPYGTT
jgi:hypothetical protein